MPANKRQGRRAASGRSRKPSRTELDRLVQEATVDCYDEDEEATALFTVIGDNLELPFEAALLGETVTVERLRLRGRVSIQAACRRGSHRQFVDLLSLELPSPPPAGAEWIGAYAHWMDRR